MRSSGVRKGAWTREEDVLLKDFVDKNGEGKWHLVPLRAGLNRCRKSSRLRWLNYLRPNIKRGGFSEDEIDLIIRLHKLLGNRWSLIAGRLPGRTANDVKNYWNTHCSKKATAKPQTPPRNPIVKPKPWTVPKGFPGVRLKAAENVETVEAGEERFDDTVSQVDYSIAFWENMTANDGTSCFSTTGGHDVFQTQSNNYQDTIGFESYVQNCSFDIGDIWDFLNSEENNFI